MEKIGERIQTLRHRRNLTQEQMAAALGVTAAAVSKWETRAACPDIAMLPPLARLLGTTIDGLLDFHPALTREEVENLVEQGQTLFEQGQAQEAVETCEKLLRQYPGDLYLEFCTASLYMRYLRALPEEAFIQEQMERMVALFESSSHSGDPEIAGASQVILSSLYTMLGETDRALELAEKLHQPELNARLLRASILLQKGELEEAEKLHQIGLYSAGRDCLLHLTGLTAIARRREDRNWALELAEIALKLDRVLRMEELGGMAGNFYVTRAGIYCRMGRLEEAMEDLAAYVEEALRLGAIANGQRPTGRLYSRTEVSSNGISCEYFLNNAALLLEQEEDLVPLRALPEYKKLLQRLKKQ